MKVVDFLKHKREILAQHPFELRDWLSPAIRDCWREFQQRHTFTPLLGRVLDLQGESQNARQQDSARVSQVANGQPAMTQDPVVETRGEAAALYAALQTPHRGERPTSARVAVITQGLIDRFAAVTGCDHHRIHTDPERAAAESPFKHYHSPRLRPWPCCRS